MPVLPLDGPRRERKLKNLAKRLAQQEARRAAMTPEQLEKHMRWHETHQPGAKADRAKARRDRELRELLARPRPAPPVDPAVVALERQLAEIDAEQTRLRALISEQDEKHDD